MNTLIVGATLAGKSSAEASALTEIARAGDQAIVVCDPHRESLAFGFLKQLESNFLLKRVVYDRLGDTDRVLGWNFLEASKESDPLKQRAENDERIRAFADVLLRRRGLQNLAPRPLIEEWLIAALELRVYQAEPMSLTLLPQAFHPRSEVWRLMIDHCTDAPVAAKFQELSRFGPSTLRREVAPAERLLSGVCRSPAFMARCEGTFDLESFLNKRGILILEGGGIGLSEDAARTIFGAVILRVIQHVKKGAISPVLLVLDEANNFGLIGPYEVRALAECQKMGLDMDIIVQALDFPDPAIQTGVLTNCTRHEWFRCGSADVARRGAEDLLLLLDPHKLHHRDERIRQLHDGYESVTVTNRSMSWESEKHRTRYGRAYVQQGRSRYRELKETTDHYQSLNDQLLLLQQELMQLAVGERYIRVGGQVWRECTKLPPDPWAIPGLSHRRAEAAIQRIKERACFQNPRRRPVPRVEAVHPNPERSGFARWPGNETA